MSDIKFLRARVAADVSVTVVVWFGVAGRRGCVARGRDGLDHPKASTPSDSSLASFTSAWMHATLRLNPQHLQYQRSCLPIRTALRTAFSKPLISYPRSESPASETTGQENGCLWLESCSLKVQSVMLMFPTQLWVCWKADAYGLEKMASCRVYLWGECICFSRLGEPSLRISSSYHVSTSINRYLDYILELRDRAETGEKDRRSKNLLI